MRAWQYVANGVPAQNGEFPSMVTLVYRAKNPSQNAVPVAHTCGGSLITTQHVLTAAHCVNNGHELIPFEVSTTQQKY